MKLGSFFVAMLPLLVSSFPSSSLAQPPPLLPPPPTKVGNPACVAAVNNLNTGACSPVSSKLKSVASTLPTAACTQLASSEAASLVTRPCCDDVRSFLASSCACDPLVVGLLSAAGVPSGALEGGVRLATASACAGEEFGGPLDNGCAGAVACPAPRKATTLS